MNRRFDSEHESGSTRTAFEALRAARPRIPTELTSVDTEEADDVFWRIVGDEPNPRVGRHRFAGAISRSQSRRQPPRR